MTTASKGASETRQLTQYVTTANSEEPPSSLCLSYTSMNNSGDWMNSQTYLKGCLNLSRWHSCRMQSKASLNSALLRPLMNTPLQPLEQVLAPTLPTHPTTIFSSMLVLGMMQPILPLPLREVMYIQPLVPKISMISRNPMKHISLKTLIHHQMISTRCIRPNKANHYLHQFLDFRGITPESQPPLHLRNHLKICYSCLCSC